MGAVNKLRHHDNRHLTNMQRWASITTPITLSHYPRGSCNLLAWTVGALMLASNINTAQAAPFAHAALPSKAAQAPCGELTPCEQRSGKAKLGLQGLQLKHITITHNAQQRPGMQEANLDCARFTLTRSLVQRYFARAGTISANAQHYIGSDSPCYASGHLILSTGQQAQWTIGIMQEATLTLSTGRTIHLHCARCTFKPFVV